MLVKRRETAGHCFSGGSVVIGNEQDPSFLIDNLQPASPCRTVPLHQFYMQSHTTFWVYFLQYDWLGKASLKSPRPIFYWLKYESDGCLLIKRLFCDSQRPCPTDWSVQVVRMWSKIYRYSLRQLVSGNFDSCLAPGHMAGAMVESTSIEHEPQQIRHPNTLQRLYTDNDFQHYLHSALCFPAFFYHRYFRLGYMHFVHIS